MTTLKPDTADAVLDAVAWAAAEEIPLEILGHGSRRGIGRPVQAEHTLDLSGLSGVTLYEPEELVLSARAGTPLAEIEELLRDHNQALAFEPMDCGPLFGRPRGRGTVGGVLESNASGPRRIKAGAARDHVLGIHAVSGRGEAFKSGGRVVKNVTGYDLSKGLAGSWGTLAVLTDVTFKVLPRPEHETTLACFGSDDQRAVAVLCQAVGSPWDVSGAVHLPANIANDLPETLAVGGMAVTLIRLEGFPPSVEYRAEKLRGQFGALELALLEPAASESVWKAVRDAEMFGTTPHPVWRVSVAPSLGPQVIAALKAEHTIRHYYDWSGGLIWIETPDAPLDGLSGAIRAAIAACGGGHATLMRGSAALRTAIQPFEPQLKPLAALSRRLKEQFDPRGILNPGRMAADDLMQTSFSLAQLADPDIAEADAILRRCVHCGFCTATCPTYLELGNELDSPRGRIYLIKDMLENDKPASSEVALHIDRCLSCLSCMTTCPSGVDYMHLIDQARVRIEKTYKRPLADRLLRNGLAWVLPSRGRFRAALAMAKLAKPFGPLLARMGQPGRRMAAMLRLARGSGRAQLRGRDPHPLADASRPLPSRERKGARVALLTGCAQAVLDPEINAATVRLLNRFGVDVVFPKGEGCCGAIVHHMGRDDLGLALARNNVDVWAREMDAGLDAILVTASGCGTSIKDYGHALRLDPAYAQKAARVAAIALDITEYLARLDLPPAERSGLTVAYHSACSMQHGQRITTLPKVLLERAGFSVRDIPEGHICCGSAGTYNILQPEIAARLRDRKVRNIDKIAPDLIATGNIGCMTQIGSGTAIPIVHTAALLDWAYGGPKPAALRAAETRRAS